MDLPSPIKRSAKRDHTKLICDINEVSGLFSDAPSLEAFLQRIVEMVSEHMHTDVCSIYLFYEDTQQLVLKATKGLNPEAIGQVSLKLGEGLTGQAVKELRPIRRKNASQATGYRYFPEIGEEQYESFLAVPILRGQTRIGALVVQNARKNYFTDEDVHAVRAITSQLANTIEMAKLLMDLHERQEDEPSGAEEKFGEKLMFMKGKIASEGLALGESVVYEHAHVLLDPQSVARGNVLTLDDFRQAVQVTEHQLETLQQEIEEKLSDVASLIFTAQILMLKDKAFIDAIEQQICKGVTPPHAVFVTVEQYAQKLRALPNEYLREKRQDVRDIGKRLIANMAGIDEEKNYHNLIVIAQDMFPSDILKLSSEGVKGIVLLSGGITSHLIILARSLQIPLMICTEQRLLKISPGTPIFLDAEQGNIYLHPGPDIIDAYRQRRDRRLESQTFCESINAQTFTRDGCRVVLLANINLLSDLKIATAFKAEGIGLYRTEFPFIVRTDFPSEEEQFVIYKKLVEGMPGKETVFRTLDIGGDKVLSYYDYGREENPFLGMRSIRFSLLHKDVFAQQLRAILRAGKGTDLKIMFPMISSVDEFLEAKSIVQQCVVDLKAEKIPCHEHPAVGMMIELPAVMEILNELAEEADFFSIGTNDFIQYMLAVDRTNEKVSDFYLPHHPAILRSFKRVVEVTSRYGKELSICGEMAHQEKYIPYFLGIGIRKISLNPHYLPKIQRAIAAIELPAAEAMTRTILQARRVDAIARMLSSH